MKVVILGGVAGGATAAARLRRLDEHAEIILLERGEQISFANCGLPYYIGGAIRERESLTLQTPRSFFRRYAVDVRIEQEVTLIDRKGKEVEVRRRDGTVYHESYDKLLLSPGAEPVRPPLPGMDDPRVFSLRTIPDTLCIQEFVETRQPRTAAVLGGGFIGLEMAENLMRRGIQIHIIEMSDQVLPPFDREMASDIHRHLQQHGVTLHLQTTLQGVACGGSLRIQTDRGALESDMLVLAAGVSPEGQLAKEAGLAVNRHGAILVNQQMQSSDPDIFAVGDAVEIAHLVSGQPAQIPLAGPANKQGRIAADNICGIPSAYHGTQGSSVIQLFDRTAASTGLNERSAQAAGIAYDKVYVLPLSHAGYYPGAHPVNLKLLFERETGRILGAQLFGKQGVDKRCDVIATAIRAGMTATDLTELELCYAPPYSSAKDPVNMAGYAAENVLTGRVKQYYWDMVDQLPCDGSIAFLDVRTPGEYASGHVHGAVNVPVDDLRERLCELDKTKPVYVNCHSGLRSYIACRILTQNGFDCYNLAGGYRLYEIARNDKAAQEKTASSRTMENRT